MSIEGIVVGLLGVVLGAAFCFAGFRYFLLLLPIWGFFVGFMAGAGATATLLGEGFLGSVIGIGVGIVVAIVFALLSYFYWWGAILVVAGTLGFWLAEWLLRLIGISTDTFIVTVIAIVAGVALGVVAFLVNAPKYVAIIVTAFAGAAWLAIGVALILGIVKTDELANGAFAALYTEGWVWIIIAAVAAAAGIIAQLQMTARWQQDVVATMEARKPF